MKQIEDAFILDLTLPRKLGRPASGSKSAAERQRISRARRRAQTCDTFEGQQVSVMLCPEATKALRMLALNCDMSQKQVIEHLLIKAYEMATA